MKSYPKIGQFVQIKSSSEILKVARLWKPDRVMMEDGSIFYLAGIEPTKFQHPLPIGTMVRDYGQFGMPGKIIKIEPPGYHHPYYGYIVAYDQPYSGQRLTPYGSVRPIKTKSNPPIRMTRDEAHAYWGKGEIAINGKLFDFGRMSYGDYFIEPKSRRPKRETDSFSPKTLWGRVDENNKYYLIFE